MKFEKDELEKINNAEDITDRTAIIADCLENFLKKNHLYFAEMTGKLFLVDDRDDDTYARLNDVEPL